MHHIRPCAVPGRWPAPALVSAAQVNSATGTVVCVLYNPHGRIIDQEKSGGENSIYKYGEDCGAVA